MRYRLIGDYVLTMDDHATIHHPGQVTWEDGVILSVGPGDSDHSPVDQEIYAPDHLVLPGLLNGHNHAAMSLLRGMADDSPLEEWLRQHIWPVEAKLTPDDIYLGTLLAAAEMIRSGTVGFADMYFEVDRVAEAVRDSGLRGWISRGLVGFDDPGEEKLAWSREFARRWRERGDGRIVPMLGPHAPYTCSPAYLEKVAEAARADGLAVHIHLSESPEEVRDMMRQYGKSPIQIAYDAGLFSVPTLIAHGVQITEADIPWLTRLSGGGVIACPVSNAKLGNGIMPYRLLQEHRIPVGLGTDGAASTNTLDMFQEMKAMAWMQKLQNQRPDAFTAYQALWAATRGTAEVLGHPGGQLAPGAPADLIAVRGRSDHMVPEWDPVANVVYAAVGADVDYTVVNGEILLADGIITRFDEMAVIKEARDRGAALKWLVEGESHGI